VAERIKILVNAIPLINIGTGIGRYMKCLYTEMEKSYGDRLEIRYFDGVNVSSTMPCGPENLARWSRFIDLFWKLPAYPAFLLRLGIHFKRELFFHRLVKDFDIYHEAGFFPFSVPSRVKTVFTLHDLSVIRFPEHHPLDRVLYSRLFFRQRCKKADHFLTVSGFTQKEMERFLDIGSKNISVTHLAHDPTLFYPKPQKEVSRFLAKKDFQKDIFFLWEAEIPEKIWTSSPKLWRKQGFRNRLLWLAGLDGATGCHGAMLFLWDISAMKNLPVCILVPWA